MNAFKNVVTQKQILRSLRSLRMTALSLLIAAPLAAQTAAPRDSARAPLTPRRAFIYSFLAPGYSQSVLGRHKAATVFLVAEAVSLAMIRESAADVNEARRGLNKGTVISWVDASGRALARPDTIAPRFGDKDVHTRQAHVEDWVAVLVANHLLAGAEAFVAASLWDVPARLGFRVLPHGGALTASLTW
jgi:hypothetical protein